MGLETKAGDLILRGARIHLGEFPNVANALLEIKTDPTEFRSRFFEFEYALGLVNSSIRNGVRRDLYPNLAKTRRIMRNYRIPTPDLAVRRGDRLLFRASNEAFKRINTAIREGEWQFPHTVQDPNVLTSALLIEGYGQFLEDFYRKPGLARSFVLGFEEVLWDQMRDSKILADVLPWMKEEAADFSPKMQSELLAA